MSLTHGARPQTTPKASNHKAADERNPFDSFAAAAPGAPATRMSHSRNNSGGSMQGLLGVGGGGLNTLLQQQQAPPMPAGGHFEALLTPGGLRTPGGVTSHAAIPTTSISTKGELRPSRLSEPTQAGWHVHTQNVPSVRVRYLRPRSRLRLSTLPLALSHDVGSAQPPLLVCNAASLRTHMLSSLAQIPTLR